MSLDRPPISGEFRDAAEHSAARARRAKSPGNMPLGAYIRFRLLENAESPRRSRRQPIKNEQALAKVLGELGKAKLANNLNQLAKAANLGSLPAGPETEQAIVEACQDIRRMREALMLALGMRW